MPDADRAEIEYFHSFRDDDHAAGVLARRPFDAGAPGCKTEFFRPAQDDALFFGIFFYESQGGFICDGCDIPALNTLFLPNSFSV